MSKKKIPILLINLSNRPERLINAIDQFRKVNMSDFITRIEACNENQAKENMYKYITNRAFQNIQNIQNTMIMPNFRALGCAMSHIKCWKYVMRSQYNGCFIAEDDIIISKADEFQFEIEQAKNLIKKISNKSKNIFITFNTKQINFSSVGYSSYVPPDSYYGGYEDDINFQNYNYINNSFASYVNNYEESKNNLEIIKNPIIGTHFYYLSKGMAKYLVEKLDKITYQIDIEIGILSRIFSGNMNRRKIFIILKTDSIKQNDKFKTDIQYHNITENEISNILNLPLDMAYEIFKYIPNCFKKIRYKLHKVVNNPINNGDIDSLINYNYRY